MSKYFSKEERQEIEYKLMLELDDFMVETFGISPIADFPDFELKVNGRLKTYLGRYFVRGKEPYKIDINASLIKYNDWELVLDTLRHEGVHMALHVLGKPFDDSDQEFIDTCNALGVGLSGTKTYKRELHVYKCPECSHEYLLDTRDRKGRYSCGACDSKKNIRYVGSKITDKS